MKYFPAILLLLFLATCSSPQKILMRTWKIDNVDFLDTLNTLSQQQKMMATQELTKNLHFTFLPDSMYQVTSKNEVINGKWWMSADKKTMFTSTKQGDAQSKVIELKKKKFKFESAGEMNQTFRFYCTPAPTTKK